MRAERDEQLPSEVAANGEALAYPSFPIATVASSTTLGPLASLLNNSKLPSRERLTLFEQLVGKDQAMLTREDPGKVLFKLSRQLASPAVKCSGKPVIRQLSKGMADCAGILAQRMRDEFDLLPLESRVAGLWALPLFLQDSKQFFNAAEEKLLPQLVRGTPGGVVSDLAEAYANALITCPALLARVSALAQTDGSGWAPHHVCRIARCMAVVRFQDVAFIDRVIDRFINNRLSSAHRIELCWALAALQAPRAAEFIEQSLAIFKDDQKIAKPNCPDALHLYQSCFATSVPSPEWLNQLVELKHAQSRGPEHRSSINLSSEIEAHTFRALQQLRRDGIQFIPNQFIAGYNVDFEVRIPVIGKPGSCRLIALECDGLRFHYLNWQKSDGLNGADLMRDRVLTKHGRRVVRITGAEFFGAPDPIAYLKQRLL